MVEQVIQNSKHAEIRYKVVFNDEIGYLRVEIKTHGNMLFNEEWKNLENGVTVNKNVNGATVIFGVSAENNILMLNIDLSALGKHLFESKIKIGSL